MISETSAGNTLDGSFWEFNPSRLHDNVLSQNLLKTPTDMNTTAHHIITAFIIITKIYTV